GIRDRNVTGVQTCALPILTRIEKAPYDKEIIVVDDASTDGTRQILEQMNAERLFPSARFIYHSVNQGKGAALRTGIREVAGDIEIGRASCRERVRVVVVGE